MPCMTGAPVRIYTLGQFRVEVGGSRLEPGRKAPRRPLALLAYLAAHAGQELPDAEVAGALWPERPAPIAVRTLSVTVYRLRRLLGIAEAVVRHERRISLDAGRVWCDAAAFERAIQDWELCARKRDRPALLARAVALYGGDFLVGELRAPWAAPIRARLRHRFARALAARARDDAVVESVTNL